MEESTRNGLTRTLGSQWSQSMTFLLLIPGWLPFQLKRLSSILLLPLHFESCSYIIRKNRGHSAQTPPFSLSSTFTSSSTPILSSPHGWPLSLNPTIHSFIRDLRTQNTTKFSGIIACFVSIYWPFSDFFQYKSVVPWPCIAFKLLPSLSGPKWY